MVTDCRFENETALIRELGGAVWHLKREESVEGAHVSEQALAELEGDRRIDNTRTVYALFERVDELFACSRI